MIELKGKVWKDLKSSWWLVEISCLNVMTQGRTRKEALEMIKDAVRELLQDAYESLDEKLPLTVTLYKEGIFGMKASNDQPLFALGLRRQKLRSNS